MTNSDATESTASRNPLDVFRSKEWLQHTVKIPEAEETAKNFLEAQRREAEAQEAYRAAYDKAAWTESQLHRLMDDLGRIKYDNDFARWCYEGEGGRIQGPFALRALHGWFEGG